MNVFARRLLTACGLVGGCLAGCGGSVNWDLDGSTGEGGLGEGVCGSCTTNQECQSACVSTPPSVYCCDLTTSINGMGICYKLGAPATTCPAIPSSSSGGTSGSGSSSS